MIDLMRTPVLLLALTTLVAFIASLVTGARARGAAEDASIIFGGGDASSQVASAVSLAALSNVLLTWAGVGVIALLVVWALHRGLVGRIG